MRIIFNANLHSTYGYASIIGMDTTWINVGVWVVEGRDFSKASRIARLTATQIILENGSRYRKSDQVKVGIKSSLTAYEMLYSQLPKLYPLHRFIGPQRRSIIYDATTAMRGISGGETHESVTDALDAMTNIVDKAREQLATLAELEAKMNGIKNEEC
jgi:hypothetical protein